MITLFWNYIRGENKTESLDRLARRVFHQTAFQISQLGANLKLNETINELTFETLKYILSSQTPMIHSRHLDQLIICAFYVVGRKCEFPIKFQSIIEAYTEINQYNKNMHSKLLH